MFQKRSKVSFEINGVRYECAKIIHGDDYQYIYYSEKLRGEQLQIKAGKFLNEIDASVPSHLDVHMILDNSAIHKTALIRRWLAKRPRYHIHHLTPTVFHFNLL